MSIDAMTEQYDRGPLRDSDLLDDPIAQFQSWFEEARQRNIKEPTAMTLATVADDGSPRARIVLLKSLSPDGFVFYTNHESDKGQQLERCPQVALVFYWDREYRQVRVVGAAEKIPRDETEKYFATRPRGSQIGAWASDQSRKIDDRGILERQLEEVEHRFEGQDVAVPPHWGGYRVRPRTIEFWQGQPSRLHDRFLYERRDDGGWSRSRLAP